MKKYKLPLILTLTFALFSLTFAQSNDYPDSLDSQSGIYCPNIVQRLIKGNTDATTNPAGQVTELQKFLAGYFEINPSTYVSGFFGRITQQKVIKFQNENNLPAYGIVGTFTIQKIKEICSQNNINNNPNYNSTSTQVQNQPNQTQNLSCTLDGQIIQNGHSILAYLSKTVAYGTNCLPQFRTCNNGTLSGTGDYVSCSNLPKVCAPEPSQSKIDICPSGQTGQIISTKNSSCSTGATNPVWSDWFVTSNSCVSVGVSPTVDGSCVVHNPYCGDTIIPNGDNAYFSCCLVGTMQLCQNGVLVTASGNWRESISSSHTHTTNACGKDPSFYSRSDMNLKKNIKIIPNTLTKLSILKGVYFNWKSASSTPTTQMGVIAQDVQKVFPEAVATDTDGNLMVNYQFLFAPIIESIKELRIENINLKNAIQKLKSQN